MIIRGRLTVDVLPLRMHACTVVLHRRGLKPTSPQVPVVIELGDSNDPSTVADTNLEVLFLQSICDLLAVSLENRPRARPT